jgi:hypothetical protein
MRSPVFVRNFEAVLVELARRGHAVHVAFEGNKEGQDAQQRRLIAELVDTHPQITVGRAPLPARARAVLSSRLRGIADYLRYLEPEFADADALRARARRAALWGIGAFEAPLRRSPSARRALARGGQAVAPLGPAPRRVTRYLRARHADVLLVSPLTHFGSPQPEYLRAARRLGLPSALVLFSWDNLTTKSLMHEVPDRVLVWNEQQAREAVEHHGVAPARIEVTGAASYDHWFRWRPSCDRRRFLSELGLDPGRPCLLYLCSSGFIAPDEPAWIAEWLDALRGAPHPLAEVNVIVRPHPLNSGGWHGEPLGGRPGVRVFPSGGEDPTHEAARRSYFDSIHHAELVVGINTTAIVESAILGRRSYTLWTERFTATQEGTLHFHQLLERNGGPLRVAGSMAEHLGQLSEGLSGRAGDAEQLRGFVHRFVRPLGLDRGVAPVIGDRIEALSRAGTPRATTLRPGTGREARG